MAKRELELVDHMKDNAVWEELAEKPAANQWNYFDRDTHTGQPKDANTQSAS